jgi:chromate transport protein ChrA
MCAHRERAPAAYYLERIGRPPGIILLLASYAVAFILPNFLIVAELGALYVHFGGLSWMTAVFYGVSPTVIALILHSCWRLSKLGMEDWLQWVIAAVCLVVTIALQAEVAIAQIA